MIRHIFKLVWNRKRTNALIITEILVSFIVLCIVVTTVAYYLMNWRRPLGFDYSDVLEVHARFVWGSQDDEARAAIVKRLQRIETELRAVDGVEHVALGQNVPYSNSTSQWQMDAEGEVFNVVWGGVRPDLREVLRLDVVSGRWLEEADAALDWDPIVINRRLARGLFRSDNPLGESLPRFDDDGKPRERKEDEDDYRVVGVLSDYRRDGELSESPYVAFNLYDFGATGEWQWPPGRFMIRVRPGTSAAIEEQFSRLLHTLAPDWRFDFEWLPERRKDTLREKWMTVGLGGTVAGFLLIMVGMGLMGVLWQNVSRRTRELGLRRALGATAPGVRFQILSELLVLTTIAALLGGFLFLQAPILGIASWVGWEVYGVGLVASLVILYYLVILCGLYPSWLATRVHPARALQYE